MLKTDFCSVQFWKAHTLPFESSSIQVFIPDSPNIFFSVFPLLVVEMGFSSSQHVFLFILMRLREKQIHSASQ